MMNTCTTILNSHFLFDGIYFLLDVCRDCLDMMLLQLLY